MSLVEEKFGDLSKKEFRLTKNRKQIWEKVFRKVQPVIKYRYSSDSKAIDVSAELGARYIDRMIDAYKQQQEDQEKIEEIEERIEERKEKWETEEIKFRHLDKVID